LAEPLIRPAAAGDLPAIAKIEQVSFPGSPWDESAFQSFRVTVAEDQSKIVGYLALHLVFAGCEGYDGSAQAAEYEILKLAVDPLCRRQGIASRLLQAALQPDCTYFLEVRASNRAAQSLYARFGFLTIGERPAYYLNPAESALVMQRKRC
jgi:[ribosomal protein S18]-alanine N-acetyltransferase